MGINISYSKAADTKE